MRYFSWLVVSVLLIGTGFARAEEASYVISYKDRHFEPQHLNLPTNKKTTIQVKNLSNETIEFESFKLDRERPVEPNQSIFVYLPPLEAGSYDFYDDFHKDVPEGEIVAQ